MENMENGETKEISQKGKEKKTKIVLIVAGAILLAALAFGGSKLKKLDFLASIGKGKTLSIEEAKVKALDFINNNLVQPGTAVEVTNATEENGLYKLELSVQEQPIITYITRNGKLFFPQAMDIEEAEAQAAAAKAAEAEAEKNIAKTDKPVVDLYVMSFCPYGNKSEDTLKPVYELLKNKVDFNFHYIVSTDEKGVIASLHGQKEVDQNEREACVLKYFGKDKWMTFVSYVNTNCGSDGACWEKGATEAGLVPTKISACVKAEGVKLMQADEKLAAAAGAEGSPTMLINGTATKKVYQYGNSETYKQAICDAFNTAPEECAKALGAATETAAGGSCN